jgi:RES domain-containing protein
VVSSIAISGEWFRCVSLRRDPLSEVGARLNGGRFNVRGEPALYLAGTPALAVAEHLRLGQLFGVVAFPPRLLVTVEVALPRVVDLTDPRTRSAMELDAEELSRDWTTALEGASTQLLGRELRGEGVSGVMFPSSLEPAKANLVVFRENLGRDGWVRVVGGD